MSLRDAPLRGPWARDEVAAFLDSAVIPLRLAVVDAEGWPRVASLWYLRRGDAILCATQGGSRLARHLAAGPHCAFEVAGDAPPYRGVRGRARVSLDPAEGGEVLRSLVERYLGGTRTGFAQWLLARPGEVAVRLEVVALEAWDYRARMAPRS